MALGFVVDSPRQQQCSYALVAIQVESLFWIHGDDGDGDDDDDDDGQRPSTRPV